jgi:hypothetical protein
VPNHASANGRRSVAAVRGAARLNTYVSLASPLTACTNSRCRTSAPPKFNSARGAARRACVPGPGRPCTHVIRRVTGPGVSCRRAFSASVAPSSAETGVSVVARARPQGGA